MKNNEKTCRVCKRILIGDSKLGLCPDCFNKYGSPVAAIGIAGLSVGSAFLLKYGSALLKDAVKSVTKMED